jgi:hypothetical protein
MLPTYALAMFYRLGDVTKCFLRLCVLYREFTANLVSGLSIGLSFTGAKKFTLF